MDTFPYLGSLITENDGIMYHVKQGAGDWGITAENMEKSQHTDFNKDTTNESARAEKDSVGFVDSKENK